MGARVKGSQERLWRLVRWVLSDSKRREVIRPGVVVHFLKFKALFFCTVSAIILICGVPIAVVSTGARITWPFFGNFIGKNFVFHFPLLNMHAITWSGWILL
jgi:hypothetical protein